MTLLIINSLIYSLICVSGWINVLNSSSPPLPVLLLWSTSTGLPNNFFLPLTQTEETSRGGKEENLYPKKILLLLFQNKHSQNSSPYSTFTAPCWIEMGNKLKWNHDQFDCITKKKDSVCYRWKALFFKKKKIKKKGFWLQ